MAKTTKKKKTEAADFTKSKLKVGKEKQKAQNATNTSFSAKAITLPSQSIKSQEGGGKEGQAPTNYRGRTIHDLLPHLGHYSSNVRRDGLVSLHQLLAQAYPYPPPMHVLSDVISPMARLIGDEDQGIRKKVREIVEWLIGDGDPLGESRTALTEPLLPPVLLHLSLALSHILPPIRHDSLQLLSALLSSSSPRTTRLTVCSGTFDFDTFLDRASESQQELGRETKWGRKLLVALLNIAGVSLSTSENSSSSLGKGIGADMSPGVRLSLFQALSLLLTCSLSPEHDAHSTNSDVSIPTWFFSDSFQGPEGFQAFEEELGEILGSDFRKGKQKATVTIPLESEVDDNDGQGWLGNFDLLNMHEDTNTTEFADMSSFYFTESPFQQRNPSSSKICLPSGNAPINAVTPPGLLFQLSPLLIASFLDSAPHAFSPDTNVRNPVHLETIHAIINIARELYRASLRGYSSSGLGEDSHARDMLNALAKFLSHSATYFPFTPTGINKNTQGRAKEHQLGKECADAWCEMATLGWAECTKALPEDTVVATSLGRKRKRDEQDDASTVGNRLKKGGGGVLVNKMKNHLERVREYISSAIQGDHEMDSQEVVPSLATSLSITATSYAALMPTMWSLLNRPASLEASLEDVQGDADCFGPNYAVLEDTLKHFAVCSSTSGAKKKSFAFLVAILLTQSQPSYKNNFTLHLGRVSSKLRSKLNTWITSLPRWLWELGQAGGKGMGNDIRTMNAVVNFLHLFAREQGRMIISRQILRSLLPTLAPFFYTAHPTRGSLPGPFVTRLSMHPALQRKCLDLVYYLMRLGQSNDSRADNDPGEKAATAAAGRSGVEIENYWEIKKADWP